MAKQMEESSHPFIEESGGPHAENKRPRESLDGDTLKSIVYAGLDATVTSFALISSVSGGLLASHMARHEKAARPCEAMSDTESQSMEPLESHRKLEMDPDDAIAVSISSKYNDIMVDEKMTTEKGLLPPNHSDEPGKRGLITFVTFLIFGSIPLLSLTILIPLPAASLLSSLTLVLSQLSPSLLLGYDRVSLKWLAYKTDTVSLPLNSALGRYPGLQCRQHFAQVTDVAVKLINSLY